MSKCGKVAWITVAALLVFIFLAGGIGSILVGVQGVYENIATNCTVINQNVVSEQCAFACTPCGSDAPDPTCGCQYAAATDYVTWEYIVYNHTYTLQTQICTDGGYPFANGYQTTCWYDSNDPNNVQIMAGPCLGWVLIGLGILYILASISIAIIAICIWRRKNTKEEKTYDLIGE